MKAIKLLVNSNIVIKHYIIMLQYCVWPTFVRRDLITAIETIITCSKNTPYINKVIVMSGIAEY